LRFIFLHELAHLKRLDLPLNWLFAVLQVIHWFNPLVWVGFARWRVDREVACDAMTLDVAGAEQNHEYGRTILRLLAGFTRSTPTPGLIGILENKQQLRQRISTIAAYAPARRLSLLTAALVAALGVVSLTDARNQSPNPTTTRKDRASTEEFGTHSAGPLDQPRRVVTNGVAVKVIVLDKDTGSRLANAEVLAPNH
jgi:bla regulator protein BlaR1